MMPITRMNRFLQNKQYFQFSKRDINVLFFGSDGFSKSCLKALNDDLNSSDGKKIIDKLGVVCLHEKQSKLPVKTYAEKQGIPISTWPDLHDGGYDIGVVVSFGKLIPKSVIKSFKYGMINVHGSLLPRWRGAAPLTHAILAGDKTAGITIMEVKPGKFDHGRIIQWSDAVTVKPDWTSEDLGIALEEISSNCLLKCLKDIDFYLENAKEQEESEVTHAPKIKTEECLVSWDSETAEDIVRKYLAFGFKKELILRTTFKGKPLRLQRLVRLTEEQLSRSFVETAQPGDVTFDKRTKTLFIKCKTGVVGATKVVYGKPITAPDFHNGSMQARLKSGESIEFE